MDIKSTIEQSATLMADQPVTQIELSAAAYSQLVLANVFADESHAIFGIPVIVAQDMPPDEVWWIANDLPVHKALLPQAEPPLRHSYSSAEAEASPA